MSAPPVEKIADAVLYEGYLLYPYRTSAVKNQRRWNFGVIYPRSFSEAQGGLAPCRMETECLAVGGSQSLISIKVRCLRLVERQVGLNGPDFVPAASIEIGGRTYESWQEAAECEMTLPDFRFAELEAGPVRHRYSHPATRNAEPLCDASGRVAGLMVRTQEPLECTVEVSLEHAQPGASRIGVRISNTTPFGAAPEENREAVLGRSLLSAHTILRLRGGKFVSLLEPPAELQEAAAACRNEGTWPVLAGESDAHDTLLSSPIILYDYPQIAPESPGDLFDGAEIDEILMLRILTLTDEEKEAMRRCDDRARRILERTENLSPEHFMKLHGVLRGRAAMNEWEWHALEDKTALDRLAIAGREVRPGDLVTLRPRPGGDVMDLALAGKTAIVESIEQDYEGQAHLAVVLEDDPGRDLGMLRQPGHRFFFSPAEVEPLGR